jgi:dolichol-phosphate mannosyltransferase
LRPTGQPVVSTHGRFAASDGHISSERSKRYDTLIGFALVGASGIIVNQTILWALVSLGGVNYLLAAIIATQGSTTWNFSLNELWVFRRRNPGKGAFGRFLAFAAVNNATLLVRGPMLVFFTSMLGIHYLVSNLITLILLFAARFLISDQLVWRTGPAVQANGDGTAVTDKPVVSTGLLAGGRPATRSGFSHLYDLHGFASVASEVNLPELGHFRVQSLTGGTDIEVRVGPVGLLPHRRVMVVGSPGAVVYEEHLGRLGANFRIDIGDRIRFTVAPLLAYSPHVVYTNVVEALLRFVLASRDFALLHSATLDIDGRGVMLSAHTDTGKTHTILRILREVGGVFLSDDMSIVAPDGRVFAYPKPLTISHHTLGAVDGSQYSWNERAVLVLKSSIHSKKGRGTGMRIASHNLPIMAINAVTQAIVPPPKYTVDRLVPCEIGVSTRVRDLFLIGRGPHRNELVDHESAIEALIENTDDAYGFPPFKDVAPIIELGGEDYTALRRRERTVLERMLKGVSVQRLTRDDFTWADDIPKTVRVLLPAYPPVTSIHPSLWAEQDLAQEARAA